MSATTATILPSYNGATTSDDNASALADRLHTLGQLFKKGLAGYPGSNGAGDRLPRSETSPATTGEVTALIKGLAQHLAWNDALAQAHDAEGIIAALRLFGLEATADRIAYLHGLTDDLDPDEEPLNLESLHQFATFLMRERIAKNPRIGMSPDGTVQTEWPVGAQGLLAMEFLPSGTIRYAGISEPAKPGVERLVANGSLPGDKIASILDAFREHLHA